jgi:hypothetical protein
MIIPSDERFEPEITSFISEFEKEQVQRGDLFIYVYGCIEYRDVTNELYMTEFCGMNQRNEEKFDLCIGHNKLLY